MVNVAICFTSFRTVVVTNTMISSMVFFIALANLCLDKFFFIYENVEKLLHLLRIKYITLSNKGLFFKSVLNFLIEENY